MRLQELGIEFRTTDDGMVRQLGESVAPTGPRRTRCSSSRVPWRCDYNGNGVPHGHRQRPRTGRRGSARAARDALARAIADGEVTIDVDAVARPAREAVSGGRRRRGVARRLVMDGALDSASSAGDADVIGGRCTSSRVGGLDVRRVRRGVCRARPPAT